MNAITEILKTAKFATIRYSGVTAKAIKREERKTKTGKTKVDITWGGVRNRPQVYIILKNGKATTLSNILKQNKFDIDRRSDAFGFNALQHDWEAGRALLTVYERYGVKPADDADLFIAAFKAKAKEFSGKRKENAEKLLNLLKK